jgi:hypothetical protein
MRPIYEDMGLLRELPRDPGEPGMEDRVGTQ